MSNQSGIPPEFDPNQVIVDHTLPGLGFTPLRVVVWIEGLYALLQDRLHEGVEAALESKTRKARGDQPTIPEQARLAAYIDSETEQILVPGGAIGGLLKEMAGYHKQPGTRKSCKYIMPGAVVPAEWMQIFTPDPKTGVWGPCTNYSIDRRSVVNPTTKKRNMRYRARIEPPWRGCIQLDINPDVLPVELIRTCFIDGGIRIGIGSYRVEKGGPYGRFQVISWKEIGVEDPKTAAENFRKKAEAVDVPAKKSNGDAPLPNMDGLREWADELGEDITHFGRKRRDIFNHLTEVASAQA